MATNKSGVKPHLLTHPITGETKTRKEWARELGIPLATLHQQLHRDRLGTSKRKWWQGEIKQGPRMTVVLMTGREYAHKASGLRCWLEWFTPDDEVMRLGKTRKVMIRVCGNDPNCAQTMTYERFSEEFRLIGSPRPNLKTLTPAELNMRAARANRFRNSPQLIPVIKPETDPDPDRRTRTRPSAHTRLLSEIASREY